MKLQSPNSLLVKLTLLVCSSLTVMAGATIAPSLPAMQDHFAATPNAAYWVRLVLTVPALFIAIGAPFVGTMIDRAGRKPLLTLAVLLYGIAGSSGAILNAIGLILVGRVLLGLSVAGIMTTATALIADYYVGAVRAQFLGFQAAFMGLGGVVFLLLGGFLADISWRMPFLIYLLALLILPLVVFVLPEPNRSSEAQQTTHEPAPPFPWTITALTYAAALLSQVVFYLIPAQLPFYLRQLISANASQSGFAIALATLFSAASAIAYKQIKARLTFMGIYTIAFLSMAVGYVIISLATGYGMVLVGLAIAGAGLGLLMPNMNVCLTSVTPGAMRGRVLGGLTTAFFFGQFISPVLSQPMSGAIGLDLTYRLAGGLMFVMGAIALVLGQLWKQ
ncbi:MFS transporter [Oscillatoria sp. FACHB-1407]|uniref:MFS transporter n=1 Tax=Oscillatoria sp. FACHB-1407 TaxID=2692847 RepID=UPI00168934AE|nr:MFS transporter [Oscillatoria sp. FACHB-1407]MBD2461439.1 MFS transporter [Oscillatoria sp. FACHB-1407]